MDTTQPKPFRFGKLPSEIRIKIYKELFCNFKPRNGKIGFPDGNFTFGSFSDYTPVPNGQDTAILRTNKAIYRKAFDTLVKTNRFVHVKSYVGVPLQLLVNIRNVPIVTGNNAAVDNFKSYVLAVELNCPVPETSGGYMDGSLLQESSLMIRHRDLGLLCEALKDGDEYMPPGFSKGMHMSVTMAPVLDNVKSGETSPFASFFSTEIQTALLAPFRATLRGYKKINIKGHIDQDLARAAVNDMSTNRWSDPKAVLADLKARKEKGTTLFRQGKTDKGCMAWSDAASILDAIHASSSWPSLATHGGEHFLSQIAETYLLTRLNVALAQLNRMQSGRTDMMTAACVDDALKGAKRALDQNYWIKGYTYHASPKYQAKLLYRATMFARLAKRDTPEAAATTIAKALELQPGDAALLRERDSIAAWARREH